MLKRYNIKKVANHDSIKEDYVLSIENGIIRSMEPCEEKSVKNDFFYAIPGFIDIHTHGGGGYEFMDNSLDSFRKISEFYAKNGTTSFLSSTNTASLDHIGSVLQKAASFKKSNSSGIQENRQAKFLGVHLEGPWLSEKNLGAQNPEYCIEPNKASFDLVKKYVDIIKMVTFSYHTKASESFLELLVKNNIIPACGHDAAYDARILAGFKKGVKVITHIYSNTSSFQRRKGLKHLGTLEMGLLTDGIKVEVIADGRHITKYFWDFIKHNKNYEDIIIITDSMRCAGLPENPEKIHKMGGMSVIIDKGVAWLEDRSTFAGSIATMYSNFKRLVGEWKVDICDAVRVTSYNQAQLLGISDRLGSISQGKTADIIFMDKQLTPQKILKSGVEIDTV
jgi:N-acetylglucosamine-6-phosphate deacetylase